MCVWGFLVSELTKQRDHNVKSVISLHPVGNFIEVSFKKMFPTTILTHCIFNLDPCGMRNLSWSKCSL